MNKLNTTLLIFLLSLTSCQKQETNENIKVFGWIEYASFVESGVSVKAKLDTGALTSSLHGTNIETFIKDDNEWVRFTYNETDALSGDEVNKVIERKLSRWVEIKDHKSKARKRPVVKLDIQIANKVYNAEFSIVDRTKFHYPMLIGRRLLRQLGPVDSGQKFIQTDLNELGK